MTMIMMTMTRMMMAMMMVTMMTMTTALTGCIVRSQLAIYCSNVSSPFK